LFIAVAESTDFELVSGLFSLKHASNSSKHASNHEALYVKTGIVNFRHLPEFCDF
jgi:hypothetical protein